MSQRDYGTLIIVCAFGILLISVARALIWHAEIGLWIAIGGLLLVTGMAARKRDLNDGDTLE